MIAAMSQSGLALGAATMVDVAKAALRSAQSSKKGTFEMTDLSGGLPDHGEFVLPEKPAEPNFRDATNVWVEDDAGSLGIRIGIEAVTEAWGQQMIWLDVAQADGRVYSARTSVAPLHDPFDPAGRATVRGAGPAAMQCIVPFRKWAASFHGDAEVLHAQQLIDDPDIRTDRMARIDCDLMLDMAVPPFVPGSLLPEAAAALGGEQGAMMSPRYEQLCRVSGQLSIDGESRSVGGQGLRIRRSGVRQFDGFWGHNWQSAVFPSGKAFGLNIYPPRLDGKPSYSEAYVFDGSGSLIPARPVEVPWLRRLITGGENVSFVLETLDGRRIAIGGRTFANTRSRKPAELPDDFPIVQQAHATYEWDGESTTGMIERSSVAEVMEN